MVKSPKQPTQYQCELCNLVTCSFKDYTKHLHTSKHKKNAGLNDFIPKIPEQFICNNCNKCYKARNSLWYHQQKCQTTSQPIITDASNNDFVFDKEFVMTILKQNADIIKENSELKNMMMDTQTQMMEVIKNGTHNTTNTNTNTNSHNKTFNLQFFLNETCKDAMNITDFVNSIQLQLTDLMNMGDVGYVNGMSNIIIKNLNDLEVHERPVHCTDVKREVLYVKDEDKWNKETEGNPKIRCAIKRIAQKNSKQLFEFKHQYPDCVKSHSKHSDTYNNLIIESMGGKGDNDAEKEDKIIKKVAKEVLVEKEKE
jgi:hypothetical protein